MPRLWLTPNIHWFHILQKWKSMCEGFEGFETTNNLRIKVLAWQLHGRHSLDQLLSFTNLAPLVPRARCWDCWEKPTHRSSKTPWSSTILQKVAPWNAAMPNKVEQPSIWFPPNTDCMYWQKSTTFVNTSRTALESRCYHGSYMEDTLWTSGFHSQPSPFGALSAMLR